MLLHPKNPMRILLVGILTLLLSPLAQAQETDQETHIKCPITRESLLELDWPGVVKSVIPAYPAIAAAKRISGTVRVDVDINPKGAVTAARVITGEKLLGDAAQTAALRWNFKPTDNGAHSIPLTFVFHGLGYVSPKEKPECGSSPYRVDIEWRASP